MIQSLSFQNNTWTTAQVTKIDDSTSKTRHLWLRPEQPIKFRPGQNITLNLPISANESEKQRTYSIANTPASDGDLELCISYVTGGKASEFLFNKVKVGTKLQMSGPKGTFVLADEITTDLVFICMGSAVAPVRSMIKHIYEQNIPHKKIHLIFGARSSNKLLCGNEFIALAIKHGDFKYSFSLSREAGTTSSKKRKYVHDIYMQAYKKLHRNVTFYVSGRPSMIEETVENLVTLGYNRNQIKYDMNI